MKDKRYVQLVDLLKKTGEDVRVEAKKLLVDFKDPEAQQRVKESLKELGNWAWQVADDFKETVEKTVRQAEGALSEAAARVGVNLPTGRRSTTAAASESPRTARKGKARGKKARAASPSPKKSVSRQKS
jgi:hypothetical protein